jgi:hypothetical protein
MAKEGQPSAVIDFLLQKYQPSQQIVAAVSSRESRENLLNDVASIPEENSKSRSPSQRSRP